MIKNGAYLDGVDNSRVNLKQDGFLIYGILVCSCKEIPIEQMTALGGYKKAESYMEINFSDSPHSMTAAVYDDHVSLMTNFFSVKATLEDGLSFLNLCIHNAHRHDQLWPGGHIGSCKR